MNLNLKGKYIIVAGGLGGIGKQTVIDLKDEGAEVTILTQNKNKKKNISWDSDVEIVNYKSESELTEKFDSLFKKNNPAGIISFVGTGRSNNQPFQDNEDLIKMWDINYFSNRMIAKSFVNATKKLSSNPNPNEYFITLTSTIAADLFINCPTEYSSSKSALVRLCKDLSWKLSPTYRVNCIAPGNIYFKGGTWDLIKSEGKIDIDDLINNKVPSRRLGNPSDISKFAVFLSSPLASFINGSCIKIDGGQSTNI